MNHKAPKLLSTNAVFYIEWSVFPMAKLILGSFGRYSKLIIKSSLIALNGITLAMFS
jgi:hypothetical protein